MDNYMTYNAPSPYVGYTNDGLEQCTNSGNNAIVDITIPLPATAKNRPFVYLVSSSFNCEVNKYVVQIVVEGAQIMQMAQ